MPWKRLFNSSNNKYKIIPKLQHEKKEEAKKKERAAKNCWNEKSFLLLSRFIYSLEFTLLPFLLSSILNILFFCLFVAFFSLWIAIANILIIKLHKIFCNAKRKNMTTIKGFLYSSVLSCCRGSIFIAGNKQGTYL